MNYLELCSFYPIGAVESQHQSTQQTADVMAGLTDFQDEEWRSLVYFFCVTLVIVYVVKKLWTLNKLPPGPWGVPVLGYSPFVDDIAFYKSFDRMAEKYGRIFCFSIGKIRIVALADAKLIRSAFSKEAFTGRPPLPVTLGIMEGYGILGAEGKWWLEQRRFLSDCFRQLGATRHRQMIFESLIMQEVESCLKQFAKHKDGIAFDCEAILSHVFGNLISQLIFGRRFGFADEVFERQLYLVNCGFKMVNIMGTINFFPFLRYFSPFRQAFKDLLKSKDEHHEFLGTLIEQHKATLDPEDPKDYLDMFLIEMKNREEKVGSTFVERQLIHVLADLFGAGYETSKVTFRWLLLYLMTNYDVQEKVQKELDDVIGCNRLPTLSDMSSLPYTEAVIMETQRLANIVPIGLPHGTIKDSELDGYLIPQGTMIMALLWSVHMNPKLFPEPEIFNPSRFIDENGKVIKPDYFLPFSAGRRMCPGDELAKMELFLLVSSIFQKYIILPPEDESLNLEPQMGFTITPLPYKLRLIPRNPDDS